MDSFKYFHICDHRRRIPAESSNDFTIDVETGGTQIDTVLRGGILLEVNEIRVLEYDPNDVQIIDFFYDNESRLQRYEDTVPGQSYYDERELFIVDYSRYFPISGSDVSNKLPPSFYEPVLHNRLRWLVKPPKKYRIIGKVRYTHDRYETFHQRDCPFCAGKGWFIDILNKEGAFQNSTGPYRIAQRVVKDLLTVKNTQRFDEAYGTTLKTEALYLSEDDDRLFDLIRMTVSEVEDEYLSEQQEKLQQLDPDETLLTLITEDIRRSPSNRTVVMIRLRIVTRESSETFQLGI